MRNPLNQPGAGWILGGGVALFAIWVSYAPVTGQAFSAIGKQLADAYSVGARQATQSFGAGMTPNKTGAPSSSPIGATGGGRATEPKAAATGAVNDTRNTADSAIGAVTGNYYTITPGGQPVQQYQGGYPTA